MRNKGLVCTHVAAVVVVARAIRVVVVIVTVGRTVAVVVARAIRVVVIVVTVGRTVAVVVVVVTSAGALRES